MLRANPCSIILSKSFTVARLLVILTRFLFNLPNLPEEPYTCLTNEAKNDGSKIGGRRGERKGWTENV
jgi:hypothetical protein